MKTPSLSLPASALAILLLAPACRTKPEPTTLTSAPAADSRATKARMRDHDAHGAAVRDAVARADLDAARREARALADLRIEGELVPTWRTELEAMNASAARIVEAKDIGEASRGLAGLARTCGDCHAMLGGPAAVVGEAPEEAATGPLRMKRHQWAAARLWEGLVVPSEDAWRAGARVLQDAPLAPEPLAVQGKVPVAAVATLAQSVHALGRKASVVDAPVDRGAVYGELMATCASCHGLLGVGPR